MHTALWPSQGLYKDIRQTIGYKTHTLTCEGGYDTPDISPPVQQGVQGPASCPCRVGAALLYPQPGGKAVALAGGQVQWVGGQNPSRVGGKVKEGGGALVAGHGPQGVQEQGGVRWGAAG